MRFVDQLVQLRHLIHAQYQKTAQLCGSYLWFTEDNRQKLRGKSKRGLNEQTFRYHLGARDILERLVYILDTVLGEPSIHKMKACLRNELRDLLLMIECDRDRAEHSERYRHETNELGIWQCAAAARVGRRYYVLLYRLSLPVSQQRGLRSGVLADIGASASSDQGEQSDSCSGSGVREEVARKGKAEVIRDAVPSAEFVVGDRIVRFYRDSTQPLNDYRIEIYRGEEKLSDYDYQVRGFPITQKTAEWWMRRYNGEDLWGYRDWTRGAENYHVQCVPDGWLDIHGYNKQFSQIRRNTPNVGGMFCTYCHGPIDYLPRM